MLDFAHSLVLRSVQDGDSDPSPALENLLATGLVEQGADGLIVTTAGQAALRATAPSRTELMLLRVAAAGGVIFIIASILGWLT